MINARHNGVLPLHDAEKQQAIPNLGKICSKNDVQVLIAALKACSRTRNLKRGKQIHAEVVEYGHGCNLYVTNSLINMYAKCGSTVNAREVFDSIKYPDVVSWNALIMGYAENGQGDIALDMFTRMRTKTSAFSSITLVSALKACISIAVKEGASRWAECRERGGKIHKLALDNNCNDAYVQNTLIDMYTKCGSMVDACKAFDGMRQPDVVSWTTLILGYADNGQGHTALKLFTRMQAEGPAPNSVTIIAAIKACASLAVKEGASRWAELRERGKEIVNLAQKKGCYLDVYVQSTLVDMYAKCGSMVAARHVFDSMSHPDAVSWNVLILGYAENGDGHTALELFTRMKTEGTMPNSLIYMSAIKACTSLAVSEGPSRWAEFRNRGKQIHNLALENCCNSAVYVQSALLEMYVKCGNMADAHQVFVDIKHPDVVSWNVLILGYADNGQGRTSLNMLTRMRAEGFVPTSATLVAALKACTIIAVKEGASGWAECRGKGKELQIIAMDNGCNSEVVQNMFVAMYAKCGSMVDAHKVFDAIKHPDIVSWNVLILGYADNGEGHIALDLFTRMSIKGVAPDSITVMAALKACTSFAVKEGASRWEECREWGKQIHNLALGNGCVDAYVQSTLLDMYAKCGSMVDAHDVFDRMSNLDVVSWTALILGYADNGQGHTAMKMFTRMRSEGPAPNSVTLVAALKACTSFAMKEGASVWAECRDKGKEIQMIALDNGCESDAYVQNTLIDMYAKCGSMVDAHKVFDAIKHPDNVSWNVLILGYADVGQGHTALDLFTRMRIEGPTPDSTVFKAALKACGLVGAVEFGRTIHSEIDCGNFQPDVDLVTCLVDFYAKCGSLVEAQRVFNLHPERRDVKTWTALLAGFSSCGEIEDVFKLYKEMRDSLRPDGVTFLCILACCSHAGLVEKGKECFDAMSTQYGIIPTIEHYNCMVDIFGRANKLDDAMALLGHMPCSPNVVTWMSILSACSKFKNLDLGRLAFQSLIDLNDKDAGAYVLMGQIYRSRGMLQEQGMMMRLRKKCKAYKIPEETCWTNEAGNVHTFLAEDSRHPQIHDICSKLESLMRQHRVTQDLVDIEKEEALCGHSERLALVCGLINTQPGKTVRIVKNVRVCDECHLVIASTSKIECKTVICRDPSRIHVFKDGKCSCGDLW